MMILLANQESIKNTSHSGLKFLIQLSYKQENNVATLEERLF